MIERIPLLAWPRKRESVLTILTYHRVLSSPDPLRPGDIDARGFERQMKFLAENFAVLPLMDAVNLLNRKALPRRACCVTFDDGYADNFTVALPILKQYRMPATLFVATRFLDGGRMFNDTIIELVRRSSGPQLDLREWDMGCHATRNNEERAGAIASILAQLKMLPLAARESLVAAILAADGSSDLPDDLMLTRDQVRMLSSADVEIGGHTASHPILALIPPAEARVEIASGKAEIEAILGRRIRLFAYPNGRPREDYDHMHVEMVRELGFEAAVTTASGVARAGDDQLQLPRFATWDSALAAFSARLTRNARAPIPMLS